MRVTDDELVTRIATDPFHTAARDASDVATECGLAHAGTSRRLVADLLACPVVELDLGDVIEIDSGVIEAEPIVRVRAQRGEVPPAPVRALRPSTGADYWVEVLT